MRVPTAECRPTPTRPRRPTDSLPGRNPTRRLIGALLATAVLATSCYSYETRTFEITIPETAESSGFLSDRHREADGQDVCIVTTADGGVATETIEQLRDMRRWSNRARNQTDALQPQGP